MRLARRARPDTTPWVSLSGAFDLITGFSTLPLQIASVVGFWFVLFGTSILAYVLIHYFIYGSAVPGFAFLASITVIFSGAQLFALGIFGEYLARMHFRSMDRPTYVIGEMVPAHGPNLIVAEQGDLSVSGGKDV